MSTLKNMKSVKPLFSVLPLAGILCLTALLPLNAYSEVPVVDDSENFAMLEQQQEDLTSNINRAPSDEQFNDDTSELVASTPEEGQPALAQADIETNNLLLDEEKPLVEPALEPQTQDDNAMLLSRMQNLQQEVQELRGQLEVQAHDLKLLRQQQLAFYKDLDSRVQSKTLPEGAAQATSPLSIDDSEPTQKLIVAAAKKSKGNPADEQISYLAAYELVKNKDYDKALSALQDFVAKYPQSGYVANAYYWLGELYLVKKDYSKAIESFNTVLKDYPTSTKVAASTLKLGYALASSGHKGEARQYLQQVVQNYPDTHTAQLATAKLKAMGS